jgi:hypothetical protein
MSDQSEKELILLLASSSASLDKSPKKNWVENAGGLPPYVRKLARGIMKSGGHDLSSAIAIAISRIKAWAAGGGKVDADTRAKATKALAQWEATKAKSAVKLSHPDGTEYIELSGIGSFNTAIVRSAWEAKNREERRVLGNNTNDVGPEYSWIEELGTDYIITSRDEPTGTQKVRYPYSVSDNDDVTFGPGTPIKQVWVDDDTFNDTERAFLSSVVSPTKALENVVRLSKSLKK